MGVLIVEYKMNEEAKTEPGGPLPQMEQQTREDTEDKNEGITEERKTSTLERDSELLRMQEEDEELTEFDKLIEGIGLAEEMESALFTKEMELQKLEKQDPNPDLQRRIEHLREECRDLKDQYDQQYDANTIILEKLEKVRMGFI